jgi:hypothetical protein
MDEAGFRVLYTGAVCGAAVLGSLGFLASQMLAARRGMPVEVSQQKRRVRRQMGAGLVLAIAVFFFVGANFLNVRDDPLAYTWIWILVSAMLVWLFILALLDIRQTIREIPRRSLQDADEVRTWLKARRKR